MSSAAEFTYTFRLPLYASIDILDSAGGDEDAIRDSADVLDITPAAELGHILAKRVHAALLARQGAGILMIKNHISASHLAAAVDVHSTHDIAVVFTARTLHPVPLEAWQTLVTTVGPRLVEETLASLGDDLIVQGVVTHVDPYDGCALRPKIAVSFVPGSLVAPVEASTVRSPRRSPQH